MMISDKLNWYDHGGYTKMTAPYSNVNIINENKSKISIVNEPFSQNYFTKENELYSTEEDELECSNKKQNTQRMRLHAM